VAERLEACGADPALTGARALVDALTTEVEALLAGIVAWRASQAPASPAPSA
jgi:hypothetical protein